MLPDERLPVALGGPAAHRFDYAVTEDETSRWWGGAGAQRHARADPPDREPVAEETAEPPRDPTTPGRRPQRAVSTARPLAANVTPQSGRLGYAGPWSGATRPTTGRRRVWRYGRGAAHGPDLGRRNLLPGRFDAVFVLTTVSRVVAGANNGSASRRDVQLDRSRRPPGRRCPVRYMRGRHSTERAAQQKRKSVPLAAVLINDDGSEVLRHIARMH